MTRQILDLLENNSRMTNEQIAVILEKPIKEIDKVIKDLEDKKIILKYCTLIDWEKTEKEVVNAFIEVKVSPQQGKGFDKVAEKIYKYNEVKSCYLMSGGFDLSVIVEGKTMKEVALFVAEKLAPLECVQSTATHFVLKKYKDNNAIFEKASKDDREAIIL